MVVERFSELSGDFSYISPTLRTAFPAYKYWGINVPLLDFFFYLTLFLNNLYFIGFKCYLLTYWVFIPHQSLLIHTCPHVHTHTHRHHEHKSKSLIWWFLSINEYLITSFPDVNLSPSPVFPSLEKSTIIQLLRLQSLVLLFFSLLYTQNKLYRFAFKTYLSFIPFPRALLLCHSI